MKKAYQKPVLEMMAVEQENMMATSNASLDIFDSTLGATNALGNEESDFDVWNN